MVVYGNYKVVVFLVVLKKGYINYLVIDFFIVLNILRLDKDIFVDIIY